MPRYKLTIAYDGTGFSGWQKQEPPVSQAEIDARAGTTWSMFSPYAVKHGVVPSGLLANEYRDADGTVRSPLRTVQGVVERAVRSLVGEPVIVMGASRTDSGVHARGQVAAFTCGGSDEEADPTGGAPAESLTSSPPHFLSPNPPQREHGWPVSRGTNRLAAAINARLPEDVVVLAAEGVDPAFDPISDCEAKGYSYTLHIGPERPLFDRQFVHHVRTPLDVDAIRRAAERIVGEHDFAAFAKAGHGRESTVRTVFECRVAEAGTEGHRDEGTKEGPERTSGRLRIEVSGNGFLYNMVRIIAGTLVDAGRGKLTPDDVAAAIETGDRRRAGPTLPPHGLCLEWIRYPVAP
ncbi:MAG: tRNA pseudouridine synthase A [Phycisphaerales bacterium]